MCLFSTGSNSKLSVERIKIRCGGHDLKSSKNEHFDYQEREVATYTIHPFYSGSKTLKNDIAVIHTKKGFVQAPNVNRICLPEPNVGFR